MYSARMSRRAARCASANVSIGTDFKTPELRGMNRVSRKLTAWLKDHGDLQLNAKSRAYKMWLKIKAGVIPPDTAEKIIRDHRRQFAAFERAAATTA